MDGVEKMTDLLGRCRIYEELHLQMLPLDITQEKLRDTLTGLYVSVLKFLSTAYRFFKKNGISRTFDAMLNQAEIESFFNDIGLWEQRVHRDASNCHSKISTLKIEQLEELLRKWDEPLMRMDSRIAVIHDDLEESQRVNILTWVSEIEYERLHYTARESRIDNSGQWLLKHEKYLAWLESNNSMILWLHGVRKLEKDNGSTDRVITDKICMISQSREDQACVYSHRSFSTR